MYCLRGTFIDEVQSFDRVSRSRSAPAARNHSVADELFASDVIYCSGLAEKTMRNRQLQCITRQRPLMLAPASKEKQGEDAMQATTDGVSGHPDKASIQTTPTDVCISPTPTRLPSHSAAGTSTLDSLPAMSSIENRTFDVRAPEEERAAAPNPAERQIAESRLKGHIARTNQVVSESLLRVKLEASDCAVKSFSEPIGVVAKAGSEDSNSPQCLPCNANPGSLGHPFVCYRPCIYYLAGSCTNGEQCGYCHLPHPEREWHLDKENRQRLANLTVADSINVLLPMMKGQAQSAGFAAEASELFRVLEQMQIENSTGRFYRPPSGRLLRIFRGMRFHKLLGIIFAKLEKEDHAALNEKAERLRQTLGFRYADVLLGGR